MPPARLGPAGTTVVQVAKYLAPGESPSPEVGARELWDHARAVEVERGSVLASRDLHDMTVTYGIPQARLGGLRGRPPVAVAGMPGIFLAGDWSAPRDAGRRGHSRVQGARPFRRSGKPRSANGDHAGGPRWIISERDLRDPYDRVVGSLYRLLGSMADAEDVVQEAWFRFDRVDLASIERPAAWLTTVTSRIGLDKLRARQRDRLDYAGPWLPEPIVESTSVAAWGSDAPSNDPADQAELADSLDHRVPRAARTVVAPRTTRRAPGRRVR